MTQSQIRNFCIIAHVDHGKSTLADRFLELTGTIQRRDLTEQTLDTHPISRERGITIKLAPVTMNYKFKILNFELNLIDTPGHVDFSYEVERTLAACEGAILLVDATQGVQAQTLSHFHKVKTLGLTIIPVINKIDLPNARVSEIEQELHDLFTSSGGGGETDSPPQLLDVGGGGRPGRTPLLISAKTGQGVPELLDAVIKNVPPPQGNPEGPTRALVFSSQFDPHRGVIAFLRLVDGKIAKNDKLKFLATGTEAEALEVGHFTPTMSAALSLETGEVGYVVTTLKDISHVQAGDTITTSPFTLSAVEGLPGYNPPNPMVFVSLFPVDQNDFNELEEGLNKLKLNDSALSFVRTESKALGRGFRVGFLGHLHAEVSQERLEKDFGLSVMATTPTVEFKFVKLDKFEEPWVSASIIVPKDYVGTIMKLCDDRRGKLVNLTYHGHNANLEYELPLAEIISDFYDQLKSKTSGYGSLDYHLLEYRPFDAVTLSILINHQEIDALTTLIEKSRANAVGSGLVAKLKEAIPRQQIPIPIQAAVNGQIVAREDIPAFRKDVTAKLYGGDVTRRKKLLEKQKKGKEKMLALSRSKGQELSHQGKQIGQVTIPNDTFLRIFKT